MASRFSLRSLLPSEMAMRQKLALLMAILVLPAIIISYLFLSLNNDQIDFTQKELAGVDHLKPLRSLLENLTAHRGNTTLFQSGDKSVVGTLNDLETKIEKNIAELEATDAAYKGVFDLAGSIAKLKSDWIDLKNNTRRGTKAQDSGRHAKFTQAVLELMGKIGEGSNLILDPVMASYYLQDTMVYRTPTLIDAIANIRSRSFILAAQPSLTDAEKSEIGSLLGKIELANELVELNINNAIKLPELKVKLEPSLKETNTAVSEFRETVRTKLIGAKIEATPTDLYNLGTQAVEASLGEYKACEPELVRMLDERISRGRTNNLIGLLSIIIGILAAIGLGYVISRGITRQVSSLQETFSHIGMGNLLARAEIVANDELGETAMSLNAMLDNILSLIQSQDEKDKIQQSIMRLLDEVSGVASGDLTKEAVVSEDITGAIADSFNYMIGQLRQLIGNVQTSTLQVTAAANQIYTSTQTLARGSQTQAEQIVNTSAAIEEMAVSIQQVSENAATSAAVAKEATSTARQGSTAVQNTIEGMNRIRDQVQETAKRIKRLGESSQEIGQIIQLIDDIADRTSILALNASIQAAMAGEAGRGFAVVAGEVERLAVRSTEATRKIATLVKTIQSETGEAVAAMEKGIQEVVTGSQLANAAGNSLAEIEAVSNRLAQLIESISQAAKQQASGSEELSKAMQEIAEITKQSAAGTKQSAASANHLANLADELRASVSTFRLPGQESLVLPQSNVSGRIAKLSGQSRNDLPALNLGGSA